MKSPMPQVLERVPLDQDTKAVLVGGTGPLRPVCQLMLAKENGDWERARESADQLHISESETAEFWWQALQWARQVSSGA